MLALLSPSKTLDFETEKKLGKAVTPSLFENSLELISILKAKSQKDIQNLMKISDNLSELNYKRFQNFSDKMDGTNSKQAIFAFKGDVYDGLDSNSLSNDEIKFANNTIGILSGLYGFIKPLDNIQAYRLEMGTKLENQKGKNLYDFWSNKISEEINKNEQHLILNLASNEYFKAVNRKALKAKVIDIDFKEEKKGELKTIGIYAKKARGMMARYIVQNKLDSVEKIKEFNLDNYKFIKDLSSNKKFVFARKH